MEAVDPLDRMERLEILGGVPLFSGLGVAELESISEVTGLRTYGASERVFTQGEPGAEMFVIVAGNAEVIHRGSDGRRRRLATLGPGDVVGELAIFREAPRAADVAAGPDGMAGLVIGAATLDRILQERPQIALSLLAALADRLADASAA
jgi:CRP-like cAMP-binding protein